MPNLFSALPVAILAWVFGSTSGLTRTETLATRPLPAAIERQQFELGFGLDVDAEDAFVDRERKLARGLADAGEHDLVRRDAGGARALELAFRDDVGAGAELRQRAHHRLVGIRLHGVADERRHVGEGVREHAVVPLERRGRIAIERRADRVRELGEIDRLGVQHAGRDSRNGASECSALVWRSKFAIAQQTRRELRIGTSLFAAPVEDRTAVSLPVGGSATARPSRLDAGAGLRRGAAGLRARGRGCAAVAAADAAADQAGLCGRSRQAERGAQARATAASRAEALAGRMSITATPPRSTGTIADHRRREHGRTMCRGC